MTDAMTTVPGSIGLDLAGDPRRTRRERRLRRFFFAAAVSAIVVNIGIVLSLVGGTVDFLRILLDTDGLSALWSGGWFPRRGMFDIATIIVGTLLISVVAMLVATPLGLGSAIYLSEYASPRARRRLKPILEVLAGIPSVVMGFFAFTFINPNVVQGVLDGEAPGFTIAAAGIGVGILVTPLVASVSEDAFHAVPAGLREAGYGLGAPKRSVVLRIVFPAAVSGVAASLILGLSRAIGETLIVAIAAGGTGGSLFTTDIFGPGQTMTGAMASLATGSDQVKGAGAAFPSLFFVGMMLFLLTLVLNVFSERLVRRVRKDY